MLLAPSNRDRPLLQEMLFPEETVCFPEVKPRVWIWDDLYRAAAEAVGVRPRLQIDPPDHWLLIRHLVNRLLERCSHHLPAGVSSPGFIGLVGQAVRELLAEDVPPEMLASSLGCVGCLQGPDSVCELLDDEGGILCRIYRDYISLLGDLDLADSSQIPSLGAELMKENPGAGREWAGGLRIRAAGFLSFASGQMAFLRSLCGAGADLELWTPECGEGDFYTAAQQFPEAALSRGIGEDRPPACVSMAAGDLRMSTDTLARELFFWPSKNSHLHTPCGHKFPGWENIALCAERDELRSITESFTRYGLPFSLREGTSVADTALWKSARRTLDLASDGWPSAETADLLSSLPFTPFDFPRRKFGEALPVGRESWTSFLSTFPPEAGGAAFKRATDFANTIQRGGRPKELLNAFARLAPSREELKRLVAKSADYPQLDEQIREIALTVREAEEKSKSLHDLCRDLKDAGAAILSGGEAVAFLEQWAETAAVWMPSPVSPSITIYPGSPPSMAHAKVWVLPGMTANRWPGQVRESPLLSDERKESLQKGLELGRGHLPLVPEKRSQREALFRRLTACGENLCILLRPMADDSGRPLPPSPFPDSAQKQPVPWLLDSCNPLERSLGDILPPVGEPVALGVECFWRSFRGDGADRGKLDSTSLWTPEAPSFSLSDLDTFISCPFSYYCNRIASLEGSPESPYRHDLAGSAIHLLWQMAWERRTRTGAPLPMLIEELFEKALALKYPRLVNEEGLARYRSELFRKVRRLAEAQQRMDEEGLAENRREQMLEHRLPEIEREGVIFKGRCDRLDILRDGRAAIFDYKSGGSKGYTDSLQLAAYSVALAEEGVETAASVYLCLKDGKSAGAVAEDAPPISISIRHKSAHQLIQQTASQALDAVVKAFSTGLFPPNYESKSCRYCQYHSLCRRRDFRAEPAVEGENEDA
ncbi:MAG: PD-(D/E)XK nuclease family protein [Aminobacteriaceae bacterium]